MLYKVQWDIEIEANTPREAAEIALIMHRDKESLATCFTVIDPNNCVYDFDIEESTCH